VARPLNDKTCDRLPAMPSPLLHLVSAAGWRAAQSAGMIPPGPAGFVHMSTPQQVALPAERLFHGRDDMVLLVLDPDRIGVEVRFEPGNSSDPGGMLFPHAYGAVPTSAVVAVVPYPPRRDGGFDAPSLPATGTPGDGASEPPS